MRLLILAFACLASAVSAAPRSEVAGWREQARRVTITRDDWGIAHVHGRTNADAVFGMIYAQAEDDFPRIEANYLTALGRSAEAEGESAIWQDLRARLYVSEAGLKADYARSPAKMRALMDAWAAGLNYYLATHPAVKPRVLTRFEPWMVLSFTEGSIGGDIERIDLGELEKFYAGRSTLAARPMDNEPRGSNGIAIAPSITAPGTGALLLINPHTSFYFRSELQMSSDEGLNAYGAATWGQFFIYQGFNADLGWMHTTSGVDNVDEYAVEMRFPELCPSFRYGTRWQCLDERPVTVRYRTADGRLAERSFTTWRTHHGPIVRKDDKGRWIAFAMMDRPVEALQQSFGRTTARSLDQFLKVADLRANSSNNTIYADRHGAVAMLMPQFMPRRDDRFDYTGVVDGSDPRTAWGALHAVKELPNTINPRGGWVHNTNTWPYRAAGADSPDASRFPKYLDMFGENPRGIHAQQLLTGSRGWTLDRLQAAAFDSAQPGFARMVPQLVAAFDALPAGDPLRWRLNGPVAAMRGWDTRWSTASIPNTLGHYWGEQLWALVNAPDWDDNEPVYVRLDSTSAAQKLATFDAGVKRLVKDFGRWDVAWGEVNRFQRVSSAIHHPFDDRKPSIAVPFGSGRWGSLASFGAAQKPGTRRWYGTSGNSFVAVVEFGARVRARAVTAGGESGHPQSPHFNDQAGRYASGSLREVYFHPDQLRGHVERTYRPGE